MTQHFKGRQVWGSRLPGRVCFLLCSLCHEPFVGTLDIQYQSGYIIHIATGIFDHFYDYEQMEATLDINKCKKNKQF